MNQETSSSSKRTSVITLGIGVAALIAVGVFVGPRFFGGDESPEGASGDTPASQVEQGADQAADEQAPE